MKFSDILFKFFLLFIPGCYILISCKKLDIEYRKYLNNSEIVYPGVPSNITCYPGKNRVQFSWMPSPDPSVAKYIIYWNNYTDSAVFNVPDGKQSQFTSGIVNDLSEGTYFFTVYAYDNKNNRSIPTAVNSVKVYGNLYLSGLVNRSIASTAIDPGYNIVTTFSNADVTNISTAVEYTAATGESKKIDVAPATKMVTISDWKIGTPVVYRSSYKPSNIAIDTFYVKYYDTLQIRMDVTATYLKNTSQPFLSVQTTNRFRDPKDWIVNAPVQNHNNMGGWGSDNNTVLCMESGWGAPDIINGKIYQSVLLPAGTYTLQVELGPLGYTGSVRLVAAVGTTLPDFVNGQTPGALASADLSFKAISFTLPQDDTVSLGFLATMLGNQYWRVTKVKLLRHY
ncbi:hypothetical protein A3860_10000 [Niastella vici]|uniref:Fibronectin type-III domain-containing protein n=1 Tax=Niastella vici TaxID=1703345 RepID=A0A1V9FEW5_9BACT|nr:DUF4998 domain-containing protein [Niastella vici]OQP56904.1 hypothetical protein A3860_10000 [Niastella vici]